MTEFAERFLPRLVPVLRRLAYGAITRAVLMLFWGGFKQMTADRHNISQLTGLPSALFYLSGVISGALMAMIGIVRMFDPDALVLPSGTQVEETAKSPSFCSRRC